MADIWMDVDTAIIVPVNIMPLLDDTDFKTIETAVVYNSAGLAVTWNFVTTAGVQTGVAITPTTAGVYDWSEPIADKGMYAIEIPASGGVSANNDTEGFGWITGVATGVLPWRGPIIGFRRAALNDLLIDGGTASTNLEDFFDGTGYVGGTAKLGVDVINVGGTAQTAGDINGKLGTPSNLGSGATVAGNLVDIEGQTDDIGVAGAGLTALATQASVNTIDDFLDTEVAAILAAVDTEVAAIKAVTDGIRIKKNTALNNFEFVMLDSADHLTPKTGLTITATRSIDGAAFAACANAATELASGVYKIDLAATDLNGNVITLRFTATGADDRLITVITSD